MLYKHIAFILKSRPEELRHKINHILTVNNISPKQIHSYHKERRKEIDKAHEIFDVADKIINIKKILVLLSLIIPPERMPEVLNHYIEVELKAHGITDVSFTYADKKEYKLELITALIYNEEFWVTAAALYALYSNPE